ncbi:MAG: hypothetical protein NC541_16000 [bacterium]|nr:hypothetical protein [bacterium]
MDLRPVNPYYRQFKPAATSRRRAAPAGSGNYYYPYVWIEPVTDRSAADVERARSLCNTGWETMTAEQREEFRGDLKGCLNRGDLERIENNMQILLDVLETGRDSNLGSIPEIPDTAYFEGMQENVAAVREGGLIHADTPIVPELPYNSWQKYNDLERILADAYEVVSSQFHHYAGGEIYSGDETGFLL